jgi:hypothetical protein
MNGDAHMVPPPILDAKRRPPMFGP